MRRVQWGIRQQDASDIVKAAVDVRVRVGAAKTIVPTAAALTTQTTASEMRTSTVQSTRNMDSVEDTAGLLEAGHRSGRGAQPGLTRPSDLYPASSGEARAFAGATHGNRGC